MLARQGQEPGLLGAGIFTAVMGRKSSICSCFNKCFFKGLTVTATGRPAEPFSNQVFSVVFFFSFFFLARFLMLSLSSHGKLVL